MLSAALLAGEADRTDTVMSVVTNTLDVASEKVKSAAPPPDK
jgi:hypothetical protein